MGNRLPHGLGVRSHWNDKLGGEARRGQPEHGSTAVLGTATGGSSANDCPFREHLLHLFDSAGAGVLFLRFGIPHDEFLLVCK
jgi:hypothetical protein